VRPRNLLAARHAPRLRRFAAGRVLIAFDYDGTLAPIVPDRDAAHPRAGTLTLLDALTRVYPVAVITGRRLADVRPRLGGVRLAALVGNHGIEPSPEMADAGRDVAAWVPRLAAELATLPGVVIEDKRLSVSVHYREAPDAGAARAAIHAAVHRLPGAARLVDGIFVVSVVPAYAPHKGDALRRLQAEHGAEGSLFAGDDITDEDAFAAQDPAHSLAVRVGRGGWVSRAPWYIPSQAHVDDLMRRLIAERARRDR
jgi:trehalose 6-phosphate phosphatase